jgi:hypothetical protein
MPLVKIELQKGRSAEYKKAILDGVHSALVEAFKISDDDRNQRIHELILNALSCRQTKLSNLP